MNTMMTSDFRPGSGNAAVSCMCNEIYAIQPLFMAELPKFSHLVGNWVEEHDCDVRFKSGSGNVAVSCMHNASGQKYANSSFIVDLAMGQIPRSTERISSVM